jgi:hypothetical protein
MPAQLVVVEKLDKGETGLDRPAVEQGRGQVGGEQPAAWAR